LDVSRELYIFFGTADTKTNFANFLVAIATDARVSDAIRTVVVLMAANANEIHGASSSKSALIIRLKMDFVNPTT